MSSSSKSSKSRKKSSEVEDRGRIATVANHMKELPIGAAPPILGSRVRIWKQDPSVSGISIRDAYLHTEMTAGPSDSQMRVAGLATVHPDTNGDFLFDPDSVDAFDAVHTYAVVRQVVTMYQRVLGQRLEWRNPGPISIFPHAGEGANAFYDPNAHTLEFLFFRPPGGSGRQVFTCRSLDIVAHEGGHAVLDGLKPGWLLINSPAQTGGLHESFGDLTSIFLVLSQLDQVEYIVAETKADLHRKNVLAEVAEEFGTALGRPSGLRNADNDLKLSEVGNEVHAISQVFTGAIYDILADAFTASRDARRFDDARVLYETGLRMRELTIRAIIAAPDRNAVFADVAREMLAIAEAEPERFPDYATFIEGQFTRREVLGATGLAGPAEIPGIPASRVGCCGTMRLAEVRGDG